GSSSARETATAARPTMPTTERSCQRASIMSVLPRAGRILWRGGGAGHGGEGAPCRVNRPGQSGAGWYPSIQIVARPLHPRPLRALHASGEGMLRPGVRRASSNAMSAGPPRRPKRRVPVLLARRSAIALRRAEEGESLRTIVIALLANIVIAAAKLTAGLVTRSSGLIAE